MTLSAPEVERQMRIVAAMRECDEAARTVEQTRLAARMAEAAHERCRAKLAALEG